MTMKLPFSDSLFFPVLIVVTVTSVAGMTLALSFMVFVSRLHHKKSRTLEASELEFLGTVSCGKYSTGNYSGVTFCVKFATFKDSAY